MTDSQPVLPSALDLPNREFTVGAPDRVWSSGFRYAARCHRRSGGQVDVLQPSQSSLRLGLRQPKVVR